ncbi:MAG TPA: alpha-2-macroglobulin family protein [Gemmataceae bacterium]|nr:alpha-2-macroglobulin family protein [Gemmataceae bacterium]
MNHVADLVDDYLHDLLDDDAADRVARHCAACPTCAAALEDARRRLIALRNVPPTEASEDLVRETVAGVGRHERRRRRRRIYVFGGVATVFAAAAAVLVTFQLHFANLSPTPTDLKVLGQTQLLAGSLASLRVQVIRHFPESPGSSTRSQGVPVEIALAPKDGSPPVTLSSFQTGPDGSGEPRFRVPDWADKDCDLIVTADTPHGPETVRQPVRVKRSWRVMLSSDKPVYQPGQSIRLRSLALRQPDLRPVAGDDATFTVTDPKGNVIFKSVAKNSAYGIASADCPLADEIIEGQYVITCAVGDTPSRLAVQVKKYVLPKFKVGVALDRPYYAPGEKVTATVDVRYFFGKPVAGLVRLEARTDGADRPLFQAGAKADDNGRAVFSFPLPADLGGPRDESDVGVTVTATVTDTAGQKEANRTVAVVTRSPLKIEVFAEGGTLVPGVANTVYVFTTYADGRPARARVTGLTSFPDGGLRTNEAGVAEFLYTADPQGLTVVLTAEDDHSVRASRGVEIPCGRAGRDFILRTDRAAYTGGDTMTVSALGSGEGPVFVDLLKDGQTLLTSAIETTDGKCAIDLPPELSGLVRVNAYRIDPRGITTQKTRTVFVRPAGGVRVKTSTDKEEYRPGQRAHLDLSLVDQGGRPVRGAVSLAAVDEAVFSVLPQAPGSERHFFRVEPDFLRPDMAAKLPPAERDRLELAWLARRDQGKGAIGSERAVNSRVAPEDEAAPEPEHTLDVSTFRAKAQQVAQARSVGWGRVRTAWMLWALALLLTGYVLMWLFVRPFYLIAIFHGAAILLLCAGAAFNSLLLSKFSAVGEKAAAGAAAPNMAAPGAKLGDGSPRVRQDFPETLLWRPEIITDDDGRAALDIDLADSITTWRLTASAITADGRLGAAESGIRVFQPFFVEPKLPAALTRGDEVSVPVVVYSYLDKPQTVELTLAAGDWFETTDGLVQKVELAPREVRSASYRLRVDKVGRHALQVTARGGGEVSDAIRREVEVVPDGRRVEETTNGTLGQPAELTLTVPDNAIEGSARAIVKVYPSGFSQLVEGLDGIFRMPYGCFEQTSSTTYPNVLALSYLRQTGRADPEVARKAEGHIQRGYQRLFGFEVPGGGFDWFGRPPANRTLTAYGLMEFQDMARVYSVDPALIERTRAWLLKQRDADGSWSPEGHGFAGDPGASAFADLTRRYLLSQKADALDDPYVLALVANALNALDPDGRDALPYLDRLEALKRPTDDGQLVHWDQPVGGRTAFYGAGRGGQVETTALATLALLHHNRAPETTRRALAWLVRQKEAAGTWPSTQATVLALKALLAGTGKPAGDGERRVVLTWDGEKREVVIPADQAEVMKQIDLSAGLKPGTHKLTLSDASGAAPGFQVAFRYHVPDAAGSDKKEALDVRLAFDRGEVRVGETVTAIATVTNAAKQAAPMVVIEVPVPAGFALEAAELDALLTGGTIDKYQAEAQRVVIYLRGLDAGRSVALKYGLRATTPAKVSVPAARAYEYYDPDRQGKSAPARLTAAP